MLQKVNIPLLFHGHTHHQLIWQLSQDNKLKKMTTRTLRINSDEILIVGVGSVGEPEDSNQPSYVIYDDNTQIVEMIRV